MGLRDALRAQLVWDLTVFGDTNLADVFACARHIELACRLRPAGVFPSVPDGVSVVECVETRFISGSLIRLLPHEVLGDRAVKVADALSQMTLLGSDLEEALVRALYTWHGCLHMAKMLRRTYVTLGGEIEYSMPDRMHAFADLERCRGEEDRRGNPWVTFGVMLARRLEQDRQKEEFARRVVEDWVPRDSPYWTSALP